MHSHPFSIALITLPNLCFFPDEKASFHCWRPHIHPWSETYSGPSPSSPSSYQNTRKRYIAPISTASSSPQSTHHLCCAVLPPPHLCTIHPRCQRSALSLLERDASSQAMRERTLESQADARADEVDRLLADARQKRLALQRALDAVASERSRHWL